ncbi:polysaccharide biosynthesis protein [Xylanimonas cellulosilytica DSM 15894]|uniref:Polysaccharide biosynthesis protein n=1 Tax=Xylanimonas cellulosilytica (strain DSM 15894 / JCM 12276 / CECT 5975 / KCTC 9989 / LMG 20990 / NBRC 107835 / XIL07) TaxID=446471 RepID=D1BZX7_XYLCX|nr:lipopolysaccharide biosynthesis protein [Xylanimonas cellulosilytica]ACZ32105.1 polysaccharide biosynthesis protein [Xylanimonas cellulosilytica DSM 15894]
MSTVEAEPTGPSPEGGLARRATASVAWSASQQWVIRITGLVTVAILARVLSPADFGVVAVAMSVLTLVHLLADMGFATYLVQAQDPSRRTLSTAFWYSVAAGTALTVGLVLLAPLLAQLLDTPEVIPVLRALAASALLVTLGSVPMALLRRELRFRALAIQAVAAGLIGQIVATVLALTGFGVWALVAQALVYQLLVTVMAWVASRWTVTWQFSRAEFVVMLRFGLKVLGTDVFAVARVTIENAIVVAALGVSGLGYLSIAQRLVSIAHDLTTTPVATVSLAVFAKIRDTTERSLSGYVRAQNMAHALVAPVMLLIALGAPFLLPLLFGSQWGVSIVPAQILALAGVLTLSGLDRGLFLGRGRPGTWFVYVLIVDSVTIGVTALTVPHGLVAYAYGFLAVAAVATAARWVLVGRQLDASWWTISGPLRRVLVAMGAAGAAGIGANALASGLGAWWRVIIMTVAVVVVYVPMVRLMLPNAWRELTGFAVSLLRRRRPREREAV